MKKWITVDKIDYYIEIRGKGKPLICLHGFSESLNTFKHVDIENRQLILIDQIGHGKTRAPISEEIYSLEYMTRTIHEIINRVASKPYDLLGYSMGGRQALYYAIKYPNEISALVLESASYGLMDEVDRANRRKNEKYISEQLEKFGINWFVPFWENISIFDTQKLLSDSVKDEIKQQRLSNNAEFLAMHIKKMGQGNFPYLKDKLSDLPMPILYIAGEFDYKYRDYQEVFEESCKRINTEIICGCGHNTHIEKPNVFSSTVSSFLNKEEV